MTLGPKTRALVEVLAELTTLLRQHCVERWAAWLELDCHLLQRGDFSGIEHLLSAFGGMGSINDVVLSPAEGSVSLGEVAHANETLRKLLSRAFELANEVSREVMFE